MIHKTWRVHPSAVGAELGRCAVWNPLVPSIPMAVQVRMPERVFNIFVEAELSQDDTKDDLQNVASPSERGERRTRQMCHLESSSAVDPDGDPSKDAGASFQSRLLPDSI